jgi:glycosyltransferase involved in cell wall biosynthesis
MVTILHVIPTLQGGGSERQLSLLAAEQVVRGLTVHVAVRQGGVHEERLTRAGAKLHFLGDLRAAHPLLFARAYKLMRNVSPDIVQTWLPQMDLVVGAAAVTRRIPWVLSERASKEAYANLGGVQFARINLAKHASAIVANSEDGAAYWKRSLGPRSRVMEIGNCVDIHAVRSSSDLGSELSQGVPTILFAGRYVEQKAPEVLIGSLSLLKQMKWEALLLGEGPMGPELARAIHKANLQDRVRLLPYRPDWWGYLKAAAMFVSPSRFEGQPNVVLEAMASGCPLVVSDIPTHRSLIDDRSAKFFSRDDVEGLAQAIADVLSDRRGAEERARQAEILVRHRSVASAVDAYQRLYTQLMQGRLH